MLHDDSFRQHALEQPLVERTNPLYEARRTARAEVRAAKQAEKLRLGQLGLKK